MHSEQSSAFIELVLTLNSENPNLQYFFFVKDVRWGLWIVNMNLVQTFGSKLSKMYTVLSIMTCMLVRLCFSTYLRSTAKVTFIIDAVKSSLIYAPIYLEIFVSLSTPRDHSITYDVSESTQIISRDCYWLRGECILYLFIYLFIFATNSYEYRSRFAVI